MVLSDMSRQVLLMLVSFSTFLHGAFEYSMFRPVFVGAWFKMLSMFGPKTSARCGFADGFMFLCYSNCILSLEFFEAFFAKGFIFVPYIFFVELLCDLGTTKIEVISLNTDRF